MPIQRIPKVRQRRPSTIHTPLIIRQLRRPQLIRRRRTRHRPMPQPPPHLPMNLHLLRPIIIIRLLPQPLTHALVPSHHMAIRLLRETHPRQNFREPLPRHRIPHIPLLHRLHDELAMLVRAQQQLDRLPHYPSLRLQRRHRRVRESGTLRPRLRLQTVQAPQTLINKSETIMRRAEEKLVVVAVEVAVEVGELVRRGRAGCRWWPRRGCGPCCIACS